jgi:hypothetical protein
VPKLFISQGRVDRWLDEGKVRLEGEIMVLPALNKSFRIRPAVHFVRAVSGEGDPHGLVGRVKTQEQLAAMRAEQYANSIIVGETAYDCEPGFVGEVAGTAGGSALNRLPP